MANDLRQAAKEKLEACYALRDEYIAAIACLKACGTHGDAASLLVEAASVVQEEIDIINAALNLDKAQDPRHGVPTEPTPYRTVESPTFDKVPTRSARTKIDKIRMITPCPKCRIKNAVDINKTGGTVLTMQCGKCQFEWCQEWVR